MLKFYENKNDPKPPHQCREICRWGLPCGEMIVFESIEEVSGENRTTPYREWREDKPILRVVIQALHGYPHRTRCTVVIEGLLPNGAVEKTVNIEVPQLEPGHSVGYGFGGWSTSIRLVGWWIDPDNR